MKKELFISLDSPYKWGQGWTLTPEALFEFKQQLHSVIEKIGHEQVKNDWDVPAGKNDTEKSYFHPMELVTTFPIEVPNERLNEVLDIIKTNLPTNCSIKFAKVFDKDKEGHIISTTVLA